MSEATLVMESKSSESVLYMALELSNETWRVLFSSPAGERRERRVAARDVDGLMREIAAAKARLKLGAEARVSSCYEAGRDGFWLDRALKARGIESLVVDSSSIEVPRRKRRAKTDRLDLVKLMALLRRYGAGERKVWSVVRVPDRLSEDIRQLSRSIERLKTERNRHIGRIKSLLATQGLKLARIGGSGWAKYVEELKEWNGERLGDFLRCDLIQEGDRLDLVERQLGDLKTARRKLVAKSQSPQAQAARRLAGLGAIAEESSFLFATELFGWRRFRNRRELAGSVGLTPTPYASGADAREQGISKAGNKRMRRMLVEIAWCWLRHQPQSQLSHWFEQRFGKTGGRVRRGGIVALARKLLVALWRYLEHGVVPEGAHLKPAS